MKDDFPFKHEPWFEGFEHKTLAQYGIELSKKYSEKEIAEGFGLTTDQYRTEKSKQNSYLKGAGYYEEIQRLLNEGYNQSEVARILGKSEGAIRYALKSSKRKASTTQEIARILMEICDEKRMIDVGAGAELSSCFYIDDGPVPRTKFKVALAICKDYGYNCYTLKFPQLGSESSNKTKMETLCAPGIDIKYAWKHMGDVKPIEDYERDIELTNSGIPPITSVDRSRIYVRYAEEGGKDRDGCIELRPGLIDLPLGGAWYAQVRIAVEYKWFMKGVIIYSPDVPKGYDIVYNTNKHIGVPDEKVFKPLNRNEDTGEIDWDNPFKAAIKPEYKLRLVPRYYFIEGTRYVNPINVVYEMGDWRLWSKNLSPQFLSKQQLPTVVRQLSLTIVQYKVELEELLALTNPAVKHKLLYDFAEKADRNAVDLKAAPYPGQQFHVLIPIPSIPRNQIYAPNYPDGTIVVLIRYPHAGRFEIPVLMVNNSWHDAKRLIKNAPDAVGIHPYVAEVLSGADFDGDSVAVIPITNGVNIATEPPLPNLVEYEPKELFPIPIDPETGKPVKEPLSDDQVQTEMGLITNLIADMEIMGAPREDVELAVKHSKTVIDTNKHCLDHKISERENHIPELKTKYQGGPRAGARTAITRASSECHITWKERNKRDDPETGEKVFVIKPRYFKRKEDGKTVEIKKESTKMYEAEDAYELLSGNDGKTGYKIEFLYCDFANELKRMANLARKEAMACPKIVKSPTARIAFKEQVESILAKLRIAQMNAPRERAAQLYANVQLWAKFREHNAYLQTLSEEEKKKAKWDEEYKNKLRQIYLTSARFRFGAHTDAIFFDDMEWLAMTSGAIGQTTFDELIRYSDKDHLRQRATPREEREISRNKIECVLRMNDEGFPLFEIASRVGLSVGRVGKIIMEEHL